MVNSEIKKIFSVDIGTSSIKGGLITDGGELLSYSKVPLIGTHSGNIEPFDARMWLVALEKLLTRIEDAGSIDSIVLSGNGPTLVAVDEKGDPLFPVLFWLDRHQLRLDSEPSFFLPKVNWLKNSYPDVYEKTVSFLSCPEYINFYLTGEKTTIFSTERFKPYIWDTRGIDHYGLDQSKFPPFTGISTFLGRLRQEAAERLNIKAGIPVFAGGADFLMALLGTATLAPGNVCDRAGTSEGLNFCCNREINNPKLRCLPHFTADYYNISGILSSTGRIFEWFRRISGQSEKPYTLMFQEIKELLHQTDKPFFFPSLHENEIWEFSKGAFLSLEPSHTAAHMGCAVVEAIGFALKDIIENLQATRCAFSEIRLSGGQARNPIWNQIKANMTGKALKQPRIIDAELLGNVIAALTGAGRYANLEEASLDLVRFERTFEPDEQEFRLFSEKYEEYKEYCAQVLGFKIRNGRPD